MQYNYICICIANSCSSVGCRGYQDGDVRLLGGSYQWEGRVEVRMSRVWGAITDSDWTDDDATVVCRALGHFRPGFYKLSVRAMPYV